MYRHFLSFLAITIDQPIGLSSIALSNLLHTPQLSVMYVHSPRHCLLVTIRISIADLIGGTRGVSSGEPPTPGHLWMWKKIHWYLLWKNMQKIWKLLKMYTWNVLFRFLNTPLGGGGAATQKFAPGGKYPRAATAHEHSSNNLLHYVGRIHRIH